jgi:hypothetical protein
LTESLVGHLEDLLLKHFLIVLRLGVLIQKFVILMDLKYLWVQTAANKIFGTTNVKLALNKAVLVVDAVW